MYPGRSVTPINASSTANMVMGVERLSMSGELCETSVGSARLEAGRCSLAPLPPRLFAVPIQGIPFGNMPPFISSAIH